ncbi:unnamed protein product (macronuclear) [Paramecium tetraurelia]|uniref:Uncharacterized protein n=1 Tax=Paramecium tetraurelia TaxID=5888 RepID=A0CAV9_PARTE|nr:uncharacterized protein GSPATT00036707001 [Paramecium tetraurelia]CAK67926.1 unnamed protein product [Paramecium tetraurelia]|eukprot:XP_001435323.1 hypothetical protein (macronuclear) [Paramecium tetraurelia strain d4-2]
MGCGAPTKAINSDEMNFDVDELIIQNEQSIHEINSHVEPKALLLHTQQHILMDQGEDSLYFSIRTPENTIPTTYSSYSALTSKKPCLKLAINQEPLDKAFTEKNVHFDNKIKVVFGDKVYLFRKVKKTKRKSSKINLDEIF